MRSIRINELVPAVSPSVATIASYAPWPSAHWKFHGGFRPRNCGDVDGHVGSIITAGQSGVEWGYRLLLLQLILVPILYMVQELTVRRGICTGKGHSELIKETFGRTWAWVSVAGLAVATGGALLTELSGVAGVGELYRVPRAICLMIAGGALLVLVLTGSYRRVERVAIGIGLFELAFFGVAWAAHPDLGTLAAESIRIPIGDKHYLYLAAANIGAVIMPWMVF